MTMDKTDMGAMIDSAMDGWRTDLDAMRRDAAALPVEARDAVEGDIEELRREFQGLRIKKVATWHAPQDQWDAASAAFDEMWSAWVERALAVRQILQG